MSIPSKSTIVDICFIFILCVMSLTSVPYWLEVVVLVNFTLQGAFGLLLFVVPPLFLKEVNSMIEDEMPRDRVFRIILLCLEVVGLFIVDLPGVALVFLAGQLKMMHVLRKLRDEKCPHDPATGEF